MTCRPLAILTLIAAAGATTNAQVSETYFGLTFVDTPLTAETPANVVAKGDYGAMANRIELRHGEPFFSPYSFKAYNVSYTRTFDNTCWQPLYLPYNMDYADWSDYGQVCKLADVFQYDDDLDGKFDRIVVAFETVTDGALTPNCPYIIRPFNAGTVVIESQRSTFAETPASGGQVGCVAANLKFMLIGTYADEAISGYFGDYTLTANSFVISSGQLLGPGGIYLEVTSNDTSHGYVSPDDLPKKLLLQIDDEILGLASVIADGPQGEERLYDLQGRRAEKSGRGLRISVTGGKANKVITK